MDNGTTEYALHSNLDGHDGSDVTASDVDYHDSIHRILIVLAGLLRQALGTAQTPSNQIILGFPSF